MRAEGVSEGEAAGAAGQRFALSVRRDRETERAREREVSWETAQEWGGRIL